MHTNSLPIGAQKLGLSLLKIRAVDFDNNAGDHSLRFNFRTPDRLLNPGPLTELALVEIGACLRNVVPQRCISCGRRVTSVRPVGVPRTGDPLARGFARSAGIEAMRLDMVESSVGKLRRRDSDPMTECTALVVDDVVTKKHTMDEAVDALEHAGIPVLAGVAIIGPEIGVPGERSLYETIPLYSIYRSPAELLYFYKKAGLIPRRFRKKTNEYIRLHYVH
jgi:hypothetical protein